ncbi:MAG: hypothetical protein KGZ53_02690 [Peptococcaceae bacterium]|nr:hypothetical protein [Peptococcaceae bacterium]
MDILLKVSGILLLGVGTILVLTIFLAPWGFSMMFAGISFFAYGTLYAELKEISRKLARIKDVH